MSAAIYFQPIKGTRLVIGAPSGFLDLLRRVLHSDGPHEVDGHWVSKLEGAAAATDQLEYRVALEEIIEAVNKYGSVRIWPEY